jgi:ATP-dependent helicase YprA (DUF1998 family)
MTAHELGINQVAQQIHLRLRRYLEAQYHVRDTAIINERLELLNEPGGISQRPFVEVTPSYAVLEGFGGLRVPRTVRDLLAELSGWRSFGVYPPYRHQADALEAFFGAEPRDLIVATGTGSGKTETFLYSILGAMALEGAERPKSFKVPGVRALLLYPMNALVSDQTSRLRRLFGDPRLAALMRERWGRHALFGMYTSRTPYAGVRTDAKDTRHLEKLLAHYDGLERSTDPEQRRLVQELRERGRWPAKDIIKFFARDREEHTTYKKGKRAGKPLVHRHWDQRLLTDPGDRELLTRHEMHAHVPDLLVTNYSMLEYMLLRPIERPIFTQTREWLSDPSNQLLLILDEAHMYRGVGGAEVGLLIRRLCSRLGIGRDRLRCIMTSASLASEEGGKAFARALTGQSSRTSFAVIRGTRETRPAPQAGSGAEAQALAELRGERLGAARAAPGEAEQELIDVARRLGWPPPPQLASNDGLGARQFVARQLTGFGPMELLLARASGEARAFAELAQSLFPDSPQGTAERATDGLLALGCFSRRFEPGRAEQPLSPTRVHLLFRGLPPVYACVNPECTARRYRPGQAALVGRLFTAPRTHCACGGRIFELLTHRDCGAAYLRTYGLSAESDFLWHERGGTLTEFGGPLHEIHLLLEEPHPKRTGDVTPLFLHVDTGRVVRPAGPPVAGTRLCYRPTEAADGDGRRSTFSVCPCCLRRTGSGRGLKIMDLATKGEQPFANLVREQFVSQVRTREPSERYPNEGRKALLFSDGRQKAARLARDLPREVERDSFREALVLAADAVRKLPRAGECVLDERRLYAAFVATCAKFHLHFFDGPDQRLLLEECARYRADYGEDLEVAIESEWAPRAPLRYRQVLLRQIGDPYYSLVAACAAVVEPRPVSLRPIERRLAGRVSREVLVDVACVWVREMLEKGAFDPALPLDSRLDEYQWFEAIRAEDGLREFFEDLRARSGLGADVMAEVRRELFEGFTRECEAGGDSGRLLLPDHLSLRLTLEDTWQQCGACGHLQLQPFCGVCANCGERRLEERPPGHDYIRTRKGFFREPLLAVLRGERPVHITAEEHTAQLSQRDAGVVYATTEEFELRFQDVMLGPSKPPVDILSCTTTMEVGIDIGSLTAVGLRTVPPQRENYQQRAGRAGRRGTSVSSVLTFAQGGAHDAHYFENPVPMISGLAREPRIKIDNRRLATRHVHSHLFQTFFHGQIDRLPAAEQRALARSRSNIMGAFGDAREFFHGAGTFSFAQFDAWIAATVLAPSSPVLDEIASWLPPEISSLADAKGNLDDRRRFARLVTESLRGTLSALRDRFPPPAEGAPEQGEPEEQDEEEDESAGDEAAGSLLDLLFDEGLLPSYAFPTGLCSFVIQQISGRQLQVKERPQLAKTQALSEYAPGRLLVVNKQTYRVGGLFFEGAASVSPAAELFSRPLRRYVGCNRCTYVSVSTAAAAVSDGAPCPVCGEPLISRDFVDPEAFCPEEARPLAETDRDQDITFASSAQLPELVEQSKFTWREDVGAHLRHGWGEEVVLVVANKGRESNGFSICDQCGGAWLDGEEPKGAHRRPFLIPPHVRFKERPRNVCDGRVQRGIFLGHEFRTDVLLLRIPLVQPMDFSPEQPWLYDAMATLSEAISLSAGLELQIDPGELSAGFRFLRTNEERLGEIYLFDTSSGGAGYAADAGENLVDVLRRTEELLADCPGGCERSCTQCLRHYGNRFLHERLDRRAAATLLAYARTGKLPEIPSVARQAELLRPLARFLELEGWSVESAPDPRTPLLATRAGSVSAVGVYPALLAREDAVRAHELTGRQGGRVVLIPDHVVEHDLPSARRMVTGEGVPTRRRPSVPPTSPDQQLATTELPVVALRALSTEPLVKSGTVKLRSPGVGEGCFAVRVPSAALAKAGLAAGSWLVLRPLGDDEPAEQQLLLTRARGNFRATGAPWTIAKLRRPEGSDWILSYGRKEKEFRPERVSPTAVKVIAAVVYAGLHEA